MGTVILIRHARSVANSENVLAGQTPGVRLDALGVIQSRELVDTLGPLPISQVFVSPLERCLATLEPWLTRYGQGIAVQSEPRIIEPDYGIWSGKKLDELALDPLWRDVQRDPESVTFPGGEKFVAVWNRVQSFFTSLSELAQKDANYIVVSHGDIIKFLIANIVKLDFKNFQSLTVEPASISIANFTQDGARLIQTNRTSQQISDTLTNMTRATLGGEHAQATRLNDQKVY